MIHSIRIQFNFKAKSIVSAQGNDCHRQSTRTTRLNLNEIITGSSNQHPTPFREWILNNNNNNNNNNNGSHKSGTNCQKEESEESCENPPAK